MEQKLMDEAVGGIGKYGRLRRNYLKDYHTTIFNARLLDGSLWPHLAEVDRQGHTQLDAMVQAMAKQEGVTEAMKAAEPLEWVRRMNSIHSRAEETVLQDVVYTF